jgi:DNA polymerase
MSDPLETVRQYVHFLHEREGVREIELSSQARKGLERLVASRRRAVEKPPTGSAPPQTKGIPVGGKIVGWSPEGPTLSGELPAVEITGGTKAEQLRHLAGRASVCVKCPHLAARRHNVVFGVGNPEAKLMFIGEGPGEEEDLKGEPFVGRAGQLLTKMIAAMGLTRADVYIANIVKCRPDMPVGALGNRKPTRQEMEACVPYLRAQIDVIRPTVMVALGATAVEGLIGPVGTIGSLRGKFLEYRATPLMPTYHPSYLLRNQSNTEKRKVWEDLLKVMERLEMPISEKQRGFFLKG